MQVAAPITRQLHIMTRQVRHAADMIMDQAIVAAPVQAMAVLHARVIDRRTNKNNW